MQGLRASSVETTDPVGSLWNIVAELTREHGDSAPAIRVAAQGTPRRLKPVVGDEVYRITGEALRNALRHAAAQHITAEIRYDERRFRVRVRDDGRGFDEHAVRRDAPAGHFGLHGMRERAEKIGGRLEVWSKPGFGHGNRVEHSRCDCLCTLGRAVHVGSPTGNTEPVPASNVNRLGQPD